ncbi:MAG: hypothetical protein WCK51_13765 [Armatimonadota bacterium]
MDERSWTLSPAGFFVTAVFVALGFVVSRYLSSRKGKYLAHVEYWVLSPITKLPDLTETMAAVMQSPGISPAEGLLFSDIRFKIGLILANKNKNAELLTRIDYRDAFARSGSAIRIQYSSETKLDAKKHLQFCVHVAGALATQVGALSILDVVADRLWSTPEFQQFLGKRNQATDFEDHVRIEEASDSTFIVRGLQKVGVPDLHTYPVEKDKLLLAKNILDRYARASWEKMEPLTEPIEEYGDEFILLRTPQKPGSESARLLRRQSK